MSKKLLDTITEAATFFISIDTDDKSSMAQFMDKIEDFKKLVLTNDEENRIKDYVNALLQTIEMIIFDELDDSSKGEEFISLLLNTFQNFYSEEMDKDKINFPSLNFLNLDSKPEFSENNLSTDLDMSFLKEEFINSSFSVIDRLEVLILELEKNWDKENKKEFLRIIHTMKGESGLLGIIELVELCHGIEDYFDKAGKTISFEFMLSTIDFIEKCLIEMKNNNPCPSPYETILPKIEVLKRKTDKDDDQIVIKNPTGLYDKLKEDEFMVTEFVSSALEHLENADQMLLQLEADTKNTESLESLFRSFHTIKGMSSFLELDDITLLSHEAENLFQNARDNSLSFSGYTIDLFFLTVDLLKSMVNDFNTAFAEKRDPVINIKVTGLIKSLRKTGYKKQDVIEELSGSDNADDFFSDDIIAEKKETKVKTPAVQQLETLKIDAEKLDSLISMVGELVIIESMINNDSEILNIKNQNTIKNLHHFSKSCRELQEISMSLRMMQLKSTFQKMARIIRDISKKLGKRINFHISGEDTELDRVLVDRLVDPLIHMIRNAADHGIENSSEERKNLGKSSTGNIYLNAMHREGNIVIEVKDDGKGLNKESIINKAISQGLIENGSNLTDSDIYQLILSPGFSTAEKVTDVSGRGVGMDVVKKSIENLRGRIEITSIENEGSTFTLLLPLTLAIIDSMVIKVESNRFVIPTLSIIESLDASNLKLIQRCHQP